MLTKKYIKNIKVEKFYIPTFITFLVLHINHMLLTLAQYSSRLYTFDSSDPTILNYLEGYANKNSLFEYQGYPTANLQNYQPGPIPFTYIFKSSWLIFENFNINPVYLSNVLLAIYPTLLIIIASTILYKNNLKLLSLTTLSITLLVQYTNNNFNASNRGTQRLDLGTEYITLIAALTLIMVILSYKVPYSSHLPLLTFSGLLLNNHFTAFALAPFTIMYALYQISLSIKAKKYTIKYKYMLAIPIIIYLPLAYRFMIDPNYLYDALKHITGTTGNRVLPDKWTYFYKTTPLELFINPCDKDAETYNNITCMPYSLSKVYIFLVILISALILYKVIKKQSLFIQLITILSIILINYNTFTGFEDKHSSIASALSLFIIIYYLSKNEITTSLGIIITLILINYYSTNHYKITNENIYKKIEKENFSTEFLDKLKSTKLKIDICNLTMEDNCNETVFEKKKPLPSSYYSSNIGQVTVLELLKNKIDICIIDEFEIIKKNGEHGLLRKLNKLFCSEIEKNNKNRNQLFLIRDQDFINPLSYNNYIKIASVINKYKFQCVDPSIYNYLPCKNPNYILEYMYYPSAALYLREDAIGINPTELLYLNNKVYDKVLSKLTPEAIKNCTLLIRETNGKSEYCYKEKTMEFIVNENPNKRKIKLYEIR